MSSVDTIKVEKRFEINQAIKAVRNLLIQELIDESYIEAKDFSDMLQELLRYRLSKNLK